MDEDDDLFLSDQLEKVENLINVRLPKYNSCNA